MRDPKLAHILVRDEGTVVNLNERIEKTMFKRSDKCNMIRAKFCTTKNQSNDARNKKWLNDDSFTYALRFFLNHS